MRVDSARRAALEAAFYCTTQATHLAQAFALHRQRRGVRAGHAHAVRVQRRHEVVRVAKPDAERVRRAISSRVRHLVHDGLVLLAVRQGGGRALLLPQLVRMDRQEEALGAPPRGRGLAPAGAAREDRRTEDRDRAVVGAAHRLHRPAGGRDAGVGRREPPPLGVDARGDAVEGRVHHDHEVVERGQDVASDHLVVVVVEHEAAPHPHWKVALTVVLLSMGVRVQFVTHDGRPSARQACNLSSPMAFKVVYFVQQHQLSSMLALNGPGNPRAGQ